MKKLMVTFAVMTLAGSASAFAGLCHGDADGDGDVGFDDLMEVVTNWGVCGDYCPGDFDHNGRVDLEDLGIVLANWGPCDDGDGDDNSPDQ